jgi:hypothetical protein
MEVARDLATTSALDGYTTAELNRMDVARDLAS